MSYTYTESDVLLYIYEELTAPEALKIKEELKRNLPLRNYYERMMETKKQLDGFEAEPHPTTVSMILEYSASHHDSLEHH